MNDDVMFLPHEMLRGELLGFMTRRRGDYFTAKEILSEFPGRLLDLQIVINALGDLTDRGECVQSATDGGPVVWNVPLSILIPCEEAMFNDLWARNAAS